MKFNQKEIKALLEGTEISDGALKGIVAMVEEHVASEKNDQLKKLTESHKAQVEKIKAAAERYGEYVKEEVSAKIGEYTNYAVKEFIRENKKKFEQLEDYERMKAVFESLKSAFAQNAFKVDKSAAATKIQKDLKEAKTQFNKTFKKLSRVNEELSVAKQAIIFDKLTENLSDVQRAKVSKLAEKVSFDNLKEFKEGVGLIIESVKNKPASKKALSSKKLITEQVVHPEPTKAAGAKMADIVKFLHG